MTTIFTNDSVCNYKEIIKAIEELKDTTRKQTGAFKYDFCYDDCIEIINKLKK